MKFKFINGPQAGSELEFQLSEITIGRDDCNILQLLTGGVSRYHASLKQTGDRGWVIYDQNSTNGVKVNGVAISGEKIVFDDDIITIGEQQLSLHGLVFEPPKVGFQPIPQATPMVPGQQISPVQAAPGTATPPRNNKSKAAKDVSTDKLLEDLKKAGGSLFQNQKKTDSANAAPKSVQPAGKEEGKEQLLKRRVFNIVFYCALAICIFGVAATFWNSKKESKANLPPAENTPRRFSLYFERILYQNTPQPSALRMELLIENDAISCVLDDVISQRHMVKKISSEDLKEKYSTELELLKQQLQASGIFDLESTVPVQPQVVTNCRRIIVCDNKKLANHVYYSDDSAGSFNRAQEAITGFLDSLGMKTTMQTREELEAAAAKHMAEANYSFENYVSDLVRLRDASDNFKAAISCYEQFQPPHPNLKEARKRLEAVNNLRRTKLRELQIDFDRYRRLNDASGMEKTCKDIMKITSPQAKIYKSAANTLRQIKQIQTRSGGSRR